MTDEYENEWIGRRDDRIGTLASDDPEDEIRKVREKSAEAVERLVAAMQSPTSAATSDVHQGYSEYVAGEEKWCEDFIRDLAFALTGRRWEPEDP